ncbi:MAG: glycosyltransferase, partial [Planctomycetes bacterium]|nr:glycosyltransferase [Planctomycetota bacterium]
MNESGPVAHLSTAKTWRGGEQQALYLMQGMKEKRDCFVIAQPGSPMAEKTAAAGIRVEEVKCRCEWDIFAILKIAGILKRNKAAMIHAHDAHAVTIAAFAARLGGGIPRLCTRRVDFKLNSKWKYNWGMDRTVCISEAIKNICMAAGIPESKLPVVRSGINLDRVRNLEVDANAIKDELFGEQKKRPLMILNVASLTDHKGQTYLLDAMPDVLAKIPQAYLVIVGEGELEYELKKKANRLALDEHCLFLGFQDNVPELLNACDLFVM